MNVDKPRVEGRQLAEKGVPEKWEGAESAAGEGWGTTRPEGGTGRAGGGSRPPSREVSSARVRIL